MSGLWPWPSDNELTIARKVAVAYRTHLHTANPQACDVVDKAMRGFGQLWVVPREATYTPDQAITADLAAELVSRTESVIRRWASSPHPDFPDRPLLPRYGWDGPRRTFLVRDVLAASAVVISRTSYRRSA